MKKGNLRGRGIDIITIPRLIESQSEVVGLIEPGLRLDAILISRTIGRLLLTIHDLRARRAREALDQTARRGPRDVVGNLYEGVPAHRTRPISAVACPADDLARCEFPGRLVGKGCTSLVVMPRWTTPICRRYAHWRQQRPLDERWWRNHGDAYLSRGAYRSE